MSSRSPETAARKLVEIAAGIEPVDGRIHIEKINAPFLFTLKAEGSERGAGPKFAIQQGWLELRESGTYVLLLAHQGLTCFHVSKAASPTSTSPVTHIEQFPDMAKLGASGFPSETQNMLLAYARPPTGG